MVLSSADLDSNVGAASGYVRQQVLQTVRLRAKNDNCDVWRRSSNRKLIIRLSRNVCCSEAGLQHARYPSKPRGRQMVPMILRNMPLWLYFRSVRSSEKLVKL